jgi:hypothetical protein
LTDQERLPIVTTIVDYFLAARHEVYVQARERNPARWSPCTRGWTPIGKVTLNPERESVVTMASYATLKQPLAA